MSGPPRVIFVNRVYWPATAATAQLLTDLAESLAVRGWPVEVVTTGVGDTMRNGVTIHRAGAGAELGNMLARAREYRRFLSAASAKVAALARAGDIVVAMTDPPMLGPRLDRTVTKGVRMVHWIQDVYPEIAAAHFGFLASLALNPLRGRRDAAWVRAAACVALGDDMATLISEQGVPRGRISILPNWAPRELHTPAAPSEVAAIRQQWGLADKCIVAYSGNLGRVHEFATMIEAAAKLRSDPRIVLLFIGTGARFDEVAKTARQRGLGNIRMLPSVPRALLPNSLAAADVHLISLKPAYRQLVYPSKLAGILAAGRPAVFIGPADSEIATLLRAADCGTSCLPGDAESLARAIRHLANESQGRQNQGRRARELYEQRFHADAALVSWEALLRRVAAAS